MNTIRCAQCWHPKPVAAFVSPKTGKILVNCAMCVERMGKMSRGEPVPPLPRDPRLDEPGLRVLWIRRSGDRKLGGIPACYVSGSTCPDACSLKGAGCYAEQSYQKAHWRRASQLGDPWGEFLARVRELKPGTLWRYAVAGDMPGAGDALDRFELSMLVEANAGRRGFAFTHKPLADELEREAVRRGNAAGFVINLSADGLADADRKLAMRTAPVVAVVPEGTPRNFTTPGGAKGVVCPAELRPGAVTCASCGLCAKGDRKAIVGFVAHGNHARRVSLRVAT